MVKRICWKKGMRLTDDILRTSDENMAGLVGNAFVLAAAGRFGLFPSLTPFEVSLNITSGVVDVESLNCLAVTKGGDVIDAQYDTKFTNAFDTRILIPENTGEKEYLLTIDAQGAWKETGDGCEEPLYTFSLLAPNTPVPAHSLPIARIVDEYGWRMDDQDFVPPCLYVSSHQKYVDLLKRFSEILSAINTKAQRLTRSSGKEAVKVFWPIIQQLMITVDKERDLMTPMALLSNVQKCVSAFTCACDLDDYLNLADAETFRGYVLTPYNYKDAYQRIKEGLDLCFSMKEKVEKIPEDFVQPQPQPRPNVQDVPAPTISPNDLKQNCKTPETSINVIYNEKQANVYFTIDGREPTSKSDKAIGFKVKFNNGYRQGNKNDHDKTITLKLMAVVNGVESSVNSYDLMMHKDVNFKDVEYKI